MGNKRFYTFCLYTIISVTLLFFLGGLVRSTGSGMGCPDWPKCFGKIVPPTDVSGLPDDYKDIFLEKRKVKAERFIRLLNQLGFHKEATAIQNSGTLLLSHDFNVFTAYTEYINRLFGVVTGFLMLLTVFFSFSWWKTSKKPFLYSIAALVMILFNGWLGSIVVDTNLFSGLVSLHFLFAFAAIVFLLLAFHSMKTYQPVLIEKKNMNIWFTLLFIFSVIQIFSGIQIRSLIESLWSPETRIQLEQFLELGAGFAFHRYFSGLILVLLLWTSYKVFKSGEKHLLVSHLYILLAIVLLQVSTGALNIVMSLPAFSQVMHITLGSLLFVISLNALIISFKSNQRIIQS